MAHCKICGSDLRAPLRVSPRTHKHANGDLDRACGECWEAWLSLQVEEKRPNDIECMFCTKRLEFEEIDKLARKATMNRYSEKLKDGLICMDRCTQDRQPFDCQKDGRVFICANCSFGVCVDCDHPEHHGKTCSEYRAQHAAIHGEAETKTQRALRSCPGCDATIEPEKASCYTQCNCGYQFCSACMVPWVGEGGAYLHGKEAHFPGCKYRTRDAESKHSLVNRWQQTGDVQERLSAKAEANRLKNEARKRSRMESVSTEKSTKPAKKKLKFDQTPDHEE